jgi:hypothetical protein
MKPIQTLEANVTQDGALGDRGGVCIFPALLVG